MPTENNLIIRKGDTTDLHTISMLAHAIWPGTYEEIVGTPQLHYMLNMLYSEDALRRQISEGQQFLIAELSSEPVGFAAFSHDHTGGAFKIHKLYVHPLVHGKGVGRQLTDRIIEEVKAKNASVLRLNVNRSNPAKGFYEKTGFTVVGEEDIAIGEGYFMNDYVMEKKI